MPIPFPLKNKSPAAIPVLAEPGPLFMLTHYDSLSPYPHPCPQHRPLDRFLTLLGYIDGARKVSPEGNRLAFLEIPGSDVLLELCHSPEYTATCPKD